MVNPKNLTLFNYFELTYISWRTLSFSIEYSLSLLWKVHIITIVIMCTLNNSDNEYSIE